MFSAGGNWGPRKMSKLLKKKRSMGKRCFGGSWSRWEREVSGAQNLNKQTKNPKPGTFH